jgi:hypothetical protein
MVIDDPSSDGESQTHAFWFSSQELRYSQWSHQQSIKRFAAGIREHQCHATIAKGD